MQFDRLIVTSSQLCIYLVNFMHITHKKYYSGDGRTDMCTSFIGSQWRGTNKCFKISHFYEVHSRHVYLLIVCAAEKCGGLSTAAGAALICIFITTVLCQPAHIHSRTRSGQEITPPPPSHVMFYIHVPAVSKSVAKSVFRGQVASDFGGN
jgi:hypothetical protein